MGYAKRRHWACPSCGPHVGVDEDECCVTCGKDCDVKLCPAKCKGRAVEAEYKARLEEKRKYPAGF